MPDLFKSEAKATMFCPQAVLEVKNSPWRPDLCPKAKKSLILQLECTKICAASYLTRIVILISLNGVQCRAIDRKRKPCYTFGNRWIIVKSYTKHVRTMLSYWRLVNSSYILAIHNVVYLWLAILSCWFLAGRGHDSAFSMSYRLCVCVCL